jgi:hypothetical protein
LSSILSLDMETANYSHEIGGWDKTHLFQPTVVATWDGENGVLYCNKSLPGMSSNLQFKPLHPRILGDDLWDHVEKGGKILGHNIVGFDLPILRDALDCWSAGDILGKQEVTVDTAHLVRKFTGNSIPLNDLVKCTLGKSKLMNSIDAPIAWREGNYSEVVKYCLSDAQLAYDLWKHGCNEGFVKAHCKSTGHIIEIDVDWA